MANIRDYLKEREKRQGNPQLINYKEKIRGHKLTVFYRVVLAVVVVAAVIAFLVIAWRDKVFTSCDTIATVPVTIVQGTKTEDLDGNILFYSKDGASCMDNKGKAIWNQSYEMQSPILSISGAVCALGDYNGREIYVCDKNGIRGTVNTNLPIRSLSVAENGVVAAVLDDSSVTRINVYNGNSNTDEAIVHAKVSMDKSGYPISVCMSPNGRIMMVSYFFMDSGSMKSSIAFYNFGEVGENQTDNYVSGYDYLNTVVPYVQFMNNSAAFAVSDDRIIFFSGSEKPTVVATSLFDDEVIGVYHNSDYAGVVFRDATGEASYRLDVYSASGNKIHTQLLDMEYSDIIFHKEQVIIYNSESCQITNIRGADKFVGSFEKPVSLLLPTASAYRYGLVTGNSIDVMELN